MASFGVGNPERIEPRAKEISPRANHRGVWG